MKRKRILVADDFDNLRSSQVRDLTEAGYETVTAKSGEEAAGILLSDQSLYGAVLDNTMPPGGNGVEILARIRRGQYGEERRHIPVLIFTSDTSTVAALIERHGGQYLDKNGITLDAYIEKIRQVFGDPSEQS